MALATLWEPPLTRVAVQLMAAQARISPTASAPFETPPARPRRWTYSPNTTAMKAFEEVYCSQVSQPVMKPAVGPNAFVAMG